MFKIIAVTNRTLCTGDYFKQIEWIAKLGVSSIIVREKALPESEYAVLAKKVQEICRENSVECILHTQIGVAKELKNPAIHLPFPTLQRNQEVLHDFQKVGTSVHSAEEAIAAEKLGVHYVVAGHIFQTDCKKGLPPRGVDFLAGVVQSVQIPVYAIGGIKENNVQAIKKTGAAGACIMSRFMRFKSPAFSIEV